MLKGILGFTTKLSFVNQLDALTLTPLRGPQHRHA